MSILCTLAAPPPNAARIQNAILGGHDNTSADREIARALAARHPVLSALNLQNRRFTERAVRRLAQEGITRFLDLGCGLPVRLRDGSRMPMIHEIAASAGVHPWVAYVDHDPIVISHVSAAVAGSRNVAVVSADLADAASLMIGEYLQDMTWDGSPVAIILTSVLHYWPRLAARAIVARYVSQLPPGSAVVISVAHLGDEVAEERLALLPGIPYYDHDEQSAAGYFTCLEYWPVLGSEGSTATRMIGGIGIKR